MKTTLAILTASAHLAMCGTNSDGTIYPFYESNGKLIAESMWTNIVYTNPKTNGLNIPSGSFRIRCNPETIRILAENGDICRGIGHHWKEAPSITNQMSFTVTVQDCITCKATKISTVEIRNEK